jgi:dephospho-CoA kinase
MSEKLIVALIGNPGSGKSNAAKHLEQSYGFTVVRPSGIIRSYAQERGLLLNERRDYIRAHQQMLAEHGETHVVDSIATLDSSRLCIDGERIPKNIERLRLLGAKVSTIALWCPIETRHQRALSRGGTRDKQDIQAFASDEAEEYQSTEAPYTSVMTVMQMADHHVDASQTQEQVLQKIDTHINSLLAA